jgi:hypothetical protein
MCSILEFKSEDFQKIPTYCRDAFSIQIGDETLEFSPEELVFIAPKLLESSQEQTFHFIISLPELSSVTQSSLISALKELKYLFYGKAQIEISEKNLVSFSFLADLFGNEELSKICEDAHIFNHSIFYSVSLHSLFRIKKSILKQYENFEIHLDNDIFTFNPVLIGIISRRCDEMVRSGETELYIQIPPEADAFQFRFFLHSIYFAFHGYQLDLLKFDPKLIENFVEDFEINKFEQFIKSKLSKPENTLEAIKFLQRNCSSEVKKNSCEVVASAFHEILNNEELKDEVRNLSADVLDMIFSHPKLMLNNENDFFDFITNQMKNDDNATILFKHIILGAVDQRKIHQYFNERFLQDISYEEISSLIQCYKDSIIIPPSVRRWTSQDCLISCDEFKEILNIIDNNKGRISRKEFIQDCLLKRKHYEELCCKIITIGMNHITKEKRTQQDWKQAAEIFKIAAECGSNEGKWRYGRCLSSGWGVPSDKERGSQMLKEIMNESREAKFFYALCLSDDDEERKRIIRELMEENDPNGFWNYGWTLYKNKSAESQEKSREYLMKAAKLGRRSYINHIELDLRHGDFGFKQDVKAANQLKQLSEGLKYIDEEFFYWPN